ncbi:putative glutamate decarboxylase [Dichotomopilus funicola]|uniref:Glutamate decarboxylase n=1 Tax=Dichotomopilus funicola TaxID=1934379 RepID=A0AAN6V1F4_9PEZI|nr:putative glutamate decarboxylase [Dichotomopilus funicola]
MNGINGTSKPQTLNRADEVEHLIDAVKALIIPFIRAADTAIPSRAAGQLLPTEEANENGTFTPVIRNVLVDAKRPQELVKALALDLPEGEGRGEEGLLETIRGVLRYSVNTWDQGFMDKLYASTNAVGVASELLLAALNTNVHVYQVSPALTILEKHTAHRLATLFGFTGPRAGGITCQGGSSSNLTSLVTARNTLYPSTKTLGNSASAIPTGPFALFTSVHGHYSVEKAAVTCGMGSEAVWTVPVDPVTGQMDPEELRGAIRKSRAAGQTPLYVNATAGTTVLGSYDPLAAIADVLASEGGPSASNGHEKIWLHVDGSWGGPAIFSPSQRYKLAGVERADSVTVNPHKMLNVPVTCSFLLVPDTAVLHRANTLPAGYLFHAGAADPETGEVPEPWDLADLTLQCGRRADSLKLALAWVHTGTDGFAAAVDGAFARAAQLAGLLEAHEDFVLVSSNPPPCLQVCFYYGPPGVGGVSEDKAVNTARTKAIVERLVARGYMIDYAPGEKGSFFRVVVNALTLPGTVEGLVKALEAVGREVVKA